MTPDINSTARLRAYRCEMPTADAPALLAARPAIEMLVTVQRLQDPHTCRHAERTADLAVAIAGLLGLTILQIETLRLAAMVHDIGKIALPGGILGKPSRLSEFEYSLVKTHSGYGYQILQALNSELPLAQIVHQHHERMDGSGYPLGLSGRHILPEARILAVADVFDAMTSLRAYRAAIAEDLVLTELRAMAVRTLDAEVVRACVDHVTALHDAAGSPGT